MFLEFLEARTKSEGYESLPELIHLKTVHGKDYYIHKDLLIPLFVKMLHEQTNESDIIARYWQLIEEDRQLVRNRSTFGPGGVIQRNGFSNESARLQKARLDERGVTPQHGYY